MTLADETRDDGVTLGLARREDEAGLLAVGPATGAFGAADLEVIAELWEDYRRDGVASGYIFVVARRAGEVLGFACYGPTPLAQGAYDLYWVAAASTAHGKGLGSALLLYVERAVLAEGGRLILIETESAPDYAKARKLYERNGWALAARIPDFYAPGSDRLIYTKYYA